MVEIQVQSTGRTDFIDVTSEVARATSDLGLKEGDLPVSEELCSRVLSLPIHTELGKDQLEYISEQLRLYFKN